MSVVLSATVTLVDHSVAIKGDDLEKEEGYYPVTKYAIDCGTYSNLKM